MANQLGAENMNALQKIIDFSPTGESHKPEEKGKECSKSEPKHAGEGIKGANLRNECDSHRRKRDDQRGQQWRSRNQDYCVCNRHELICPFNVVFQSVVAVLSN